MKLLLSIFEFCLRGSVHHSQKSRVFTINKRA
jgi:hypothetical protein